MWILNFEVYSKEKDQGKYVENLIEGEKIMERGIKNKVLKYACPYSGIL